jgi:hypothetical protein
MGGPGSGTWIRCNAKKLIEHQHYIDLRDLKRDKLLSPGERGKIVWYQASEETGSVSFRVHKDSIVLKYGYQATIDTSEIVEQVIPFDHTPCNYGGKRKWFLCRGCGGRVLALYGVGKLFLCRNLSPCSTVIGIFSFKNVHKYLVSHSEDAVFAQLS